MAKKVAMSPGLIDALQTGSIADLLTPGLKIEVLKSRKRRWLYRRQMPGTNLMISMFGGLYPGQTIADAREWARGLNEKIEAGIDPREAQRAEKARAEMTVAKAHGLYMVAAREGRSSRAKRPNKPRTISDKLEIYDRDIAPMLAKRSVYEVSEADLIKLVEAKGKTAKVRANRLAAELKVFFGWAASLRGLEVGLESDPSRRLGDLRFPETARTRKLTLLLLRLGLHLGLRQKNLRELLCCPRGGQPTSERQLELRRRGELRWSDRDGGWEVLIPSSAFKNANSSFFAGKPFRLVLPDLGGLYRYIGEYLATHRAALLNGAEDPGTFFVKTVKTTSQDASYSQTTFYEAWRLVIQRFGIRNPYTGRGAIEGLLPHGPHNVRDVLATHILKQTGSYEQASYAIQDTPETVQKHYGRFLPQDKAALAAQILNRVWEAA